MKLCGAGVLRMENRPLIAGVLVNVAEEEEEPEETMKVVSLWVEEGAELVNGLSVEAGRSGRPRVAPWRRDCRTG